MVELHSNEVLGIDVSHHQGNIDWKKVAASGIKWASIKATEALHFVDNRFHKNIREAYDAGLTVIPYHFAHHVNHPLDEARHFLQVIGGSSKQKVVLDWEWRLDTINPTDQADWINEFQKYFPNVIIYCSRYPAGLLNRHISMPFWIAAPQAAGWPKLDRNEVIAWQYNWKGSVPGITGPVDLDVVKSGR